MQIKVSYDIVKEIQDASYLFGWYLSCLPLEAYADNLVQICPRHVTHDIIPVTMKKDCLSFSKVPRNSIYPPVIGS